MNHDYTENICSAEQLPGLLEKDSVAILDCSWYLPSQQRDTSKEFLETHIPGAQFFHIDLICDQSSELPHMLPGAAEFEQAVSSLGISNEQIVIVYDTAGIFSAARVWWMFKVFGHSDVRVLNGGLPAWLATGGAVTQTQSQAVVSDYRASLELERVCSKQQLIDNISTAQFTVLDARSSGRYLGIAAEPRPGLPSGHMPNSLSLPFDQLLSDGKLRSKSELQSVFSNLGLNERSQIVTSCGSGVTAAIITLCLAEAGYGLQQLYDGAWTEWASASDTDIITQGAA